MTVCVHMHTRVVCVLFVWHRLCAMPCELLIVRGFVGGGVLLSVYIMFLAVLLVLTTSDSCVQ